MKIPIKNYLKSLLQKMIDVKFFDQGHNKPTKKSVGYVTISRRVQ